MKRSPADASEVEPAHKPTVADEGKGETLSCSCHGKAPFDIFEVELFREELLLPHGLPRREVVSVSQIGVGEERRILWPKEAQMDICSELLRIEHLSRLPTVARAGPIRSFLSQ